MRSGIAELDSGDWDTLGMSELGGGRGQYYWRSGVVELEVSGITGGFITSNFNCQSRFIQIIKQNSDSSSGMDFRY